MALLAVDPSLRASGWALFEEGQLVSCGLVRTKGPLPEACRQVLESITAFGWEADVTELVVEWPQIYQRAQRKGASFANPNDLLAVAAVAGVFLSWIPAGRVLTPVPREWKGSTPKHIHAVRILARLPESSRALVTHCGAPKSLLHNVIDAVGIGVWAINDLSLRHHDISA